MANRYWVGGTGAWDGTAGTKWAATQGGPGGETVPTTADDVFFTGAGITVTISAGNTGAKSINCTGFGGTLSGSAAITVAGSITLSSTTNHQYFGTYTITGTGTITSAGRGFTTTVINGAGIIVTLADALVVGVTRDLTVLAGTFDTANFAVTCASIRTSGTAARTINLGSSTVQASGASTGISFVDPANLTFNAGTSQINLSGTATSLVGGSKTFYNVSFTAIGSSSTRGITGSNTFNNLTLGTGGGIGLSAFSISANQTVNGTFTCAQGSGASAINIRGFVFSNDPGIARTITAAAIAANNCDFRDITLAGAAAGAAPANAGNCGGNSGIIFPAAKTVYRVSGDSTWLGLSSWALSSGGPGSDNNFPLAQDAIVIDNGALTSQLTIDQSCNLGSLNMSNRTNSLSMKYNFNCNWHGDHTLSGSSFVSYQANAVTQVFAGRSANGMLFTSNGKNLSGLGITVDTPGGIFGLGDALSIDRGLSVRRGTFDANNFNVTCTTFDSSFDTSLGSFVRNIFMGSGVWTLTGIGVVWNTAVTTGLILDKGTSDILLSSNDGINSRTFSGGGLSYNKLTIGGTSGSGSVLFFIGINSFAEIKSIKTVSHTISFQQNQGIIDTWSVSGSGAFTVTVVSSSTGIPRSFTLKNVTSNIGYLLVRDIQEISGSKFYVGTNSTNGGNNGNVYFFDPLFRVGNMLAMFS